MTWADAAPVIEYIRNVHRAARLNGAQPIIDACDKAISALRAQVAAEKDNQLKTTWATPESCPRCMEHLSMDWSFCPECGRPTNWSKNEPLSPEELREMAGEPAWCVEYQCWGIVQIDTIGRWANKLFFAGSFHLGGLTTNFERDIEQCGLTLYRRKPEEGMPDA